MTIHNHPIEAEELMAYLDGELTPEQATAAATHLENCMECQQLAADLGGVSKKLKTWEVESRIETMPKSVAGALKRRLTETKPASASMPWYRRPQLRGWLPVFASCAVAATLVVALLPFKRGSTQDRMIEIGSSSAIRLRKTPSASQTQAEGIVGGIAPAPPSAVTLSAPGVAADSNGLSHGTGDQVQNSFSVDRQPSADGQSRYHQWLAKSGTAGANGIIADQSISAQPQAQQRAQSDQRQTSNAISGTPLVIRTAALALTAKDFDKARAQVEDILKRHSGYIGSLNVTANPGAGRSLSATLRIPSAQLDAAILDFKTLGRLDSESQNGEDVTSQYVDLNARLDNSRHTEQRLTDLLQNRTGKLSDVLSVENELARVRGEIESMEAERKSMANQVDFATLNLTLNEDYRAQLQVVPPSTPTRLINAAVEGYRNLTDGLMSVALFFLTSGPSLLLWTAILFIPARFAWNKLRRSLAAQ
jgi:anti-sigma factor RsiW